MHDTVFDYGSHDKGRTKILFDLFILWLMIAASVAQSSRGLQKNQSLLFPFLRADKNASMHPDHSNFCLYKVFSPSSQNTNNLRR